MYLTIVPIQYMHHWILFLVMFKTSEFCWILQGILSSLRSACLVMISPHFWKSLPGLHSHHFNSPSLKFGHATGVHRLRLRTAERIARYIYGILNIMYASYRSYIITPTSSAGFNSCSKYAAARCLAHHLCPDPTVSAALMSCSSYNKDQVISFRPSSHTGGFNPSEKYESQLGWLFPVYEKIKFMFQTTNQF